MSRETWTNPGPEIRSSDSRTARSTPTRSISLIVKTRTPASRSSRRSPSSSCARADERDPLRIDRGERPGLALEAGPGEAERGGERHPVHVPARARRRGIDVRVRVDPEHAADSVHGREPAQRSQRDRVIAAENERERTARGHLRNTRRDELAGVVDLRQEAGALVAERCRLGHRRRDVALVPDGVAETRRAAPRAPRSGSPTVPCPRLVSPGRGRGSHR